MSTKPWDIYAQQLFPVGYGHPLWLPEPSSTSGREVLIGDVGWLKEGEFRALFNSMKDASDPVNQEKNVPRDFTVFSPANISIGRSDKITASMVFSRSINANEAQADIAAVAPTPVPASGGVGWRIQTRSDAGAMVMLNPPGVAEDIESRRHIVNYMRNNFDSWLEFANASYSWGLDLRHEDIIFVCGTLKTTQWAVAAFQGTMYRNKEGYVSGQIGSYGNVGFSVKISNDLLPTTHHRAGPRFPAPQVGDQRRLSYPGHDTPAGTAVGPNQCLFVHYYKMKRRLWWKEPMQAGAGPHQLPPGADNPGSDAASPGEGGSMYEFEQEGYGREDAYDPVNHLLDYILRTTDADTAIASDLDLFALFRDRIFPDDISEAIMQLSPPVDLDDDGVGTISAEYSFVRKRRERDQEEGDEDEFAKRSRHYEGMSEDASTGYDLPNPQYGYGDWNPAGLSSAGPSYGAVGDQGYFPQAPQYPQGMPYQQGIHYPPGTEFAQGMSYQQGMPYQPDIEYAQGAGQPQAIYASPEHAAQQGMVPAGYSIPPLPTEEGMYPPPGLPVPVGMLPPPRELPPSPQGVPYLPPFPPQGGAPPQHGGGGDNDATPEPEEKAAGKRPEWGASTSVHDGSVTALAYSADGKYVASGSEDATIIIWDAIGHAARHRVPLGDETGHEDTVTALAFSRDNIYLASASHDGQLIIWAVANGRVHKRITPNSAIHSLAYTPDGKYLIAGASDGELLLWDADTYELAETLTRSTAVVTFIIFSPDGSLMATGGTESVCHIWKTADIAAGEPLSVLTGHRGMVCAAAFSNDNRRIITASDDGSSRIWNALTGEALVMLHEHTGPVWTVAFSPDGKRIASGSSDSTVKVCDSYSGERQLSLEGHDSMINAVEFSPDGKYIASAASDNTVRLWSAVDGTNQTTFNEHNDNVTTVMFARDGSTLASGSHDGTVRIRPLMIAHDHHEHD